MRTECLNLIGDGAFLKQEEKTTFDDFKFTSCNECVHKVDNKFTVICTKCKHFYGCQFIKKG